MEELIEQIGQTVDLSNAFSETTRKKLASDLQRAGIKAKPNQYLSFTVILSAFISLISSLSLFALGANWLLSLALLVIAFAISFNLLLNLPAIKKQARAQEIEREMAIALRAISIETSGGASFEKVLSSIARSKYGELSKELKRVLNEVENGGESMSSALRKMALRTDSLLVQRACMQLVFEYTHGFTNEGLKRLAKEMIETQKARNRKFAAQASFLGLAFIAVSCIVPALFAAYAIVGSTFLEMTFAPTELLLAFAVVFPAADIALLLLLRSRTPKTLSAGW